MLDFDKQREINLTTQIQKIFIENPTTEFTIPMIAAHFEDVATPQMILPRLAALQKQMILDSVIKEGKRYWFLSFDPRIEALKEFEKACRKFKKSFPDVEIIIRGELE